MSNNDPRIETILSALEKYSTSLGQQLAFNQQTDQRFAALINRLDQFETRFNNLEALMKQPTNSPSSVSHHLSTSQSKSESQSVDPSANVDASDSDKPQPAPSKTTWASIASKPPAPLTDRKRQALHRFFNPPVTEPNQNGSYTFVYLPRSRRMNRNQIRSKFRAISIDNLRILDLNFPARNTIVVLLHEAYLPEFQLKLLEKIDSHLIQDFDPLDHHHIADPKYQDLSEERRTQLAKALHQDRCIHTLYYFIRPTSFPVLLNIINQRLPHPTKRRPGPHSTVVQTLQASQASDLSVPPSSNTPISAPQIPPTPTLQDWFGNPVSTQDMDITPDFASNASASEGSRSSSPISDAVDFSQ
ncbi:hypothetical protein PS15m_009746 [Mucor circinelloides]